MAIRLGGNTNITLTNTSFTVVDGGYPPMVVSLFTAASAGNYHFEGDLLDSGNIAVSISINSTPKEIWSYYDGVTHHVTYEFTLTAGDIVTLEAAGNGTGSNLTVTRYADKLKEIFVGEGIPVDDYSAMRGPCPEGYHVPSNDEWVALYNAGINLGARTSSVGAPVSTYLKMPTAGYRYFQTSDPGGTEYGDYWSCTLSSRSANNFGFSLNGIINPTGGSPCTDGLSIRPFKDLSVAPDNTWTTLYNGSSVATGAGIFYNSTLGIISISENGTSRITIADKNLGATTVYNSGNTLSEANCGKFYQWGNNYGFPWTGTVTTSSTQVNTTGYGPGNYYSSSTFITSGTYPYDWSITKNANLRGGETGMVIKHIGNVKEVYVGTTKVWPETYEVSYNLRGGSLNGWIDAGGDTITTNTSYGFDSNGMYITGSGTDKYFALFAELPDLTNAKKITVSFSAYFISGSWSNNKRLGIASINNRDYASGDFLLLSLAYNSSSPSRYNGAGLSNVVNNSEQWLQKEAVGYATGDVVATLEIDLTTGGLVGTITGANTKNYSATLSSSQLEAIKAYKYVFYEKEEGYQFRNERLKDVYFKVEY